MVPGGDGGGIPGEAERRGRLVLHDRAGCREKARAAPTPNSATAPSGAPPTRAPRRPGRRAESHGLDFVAAGFVVGGNSTFTPLNTISPSHTSNVSVVPAAASVLG